MIMTMKATLAAVVTLIASGCDSRCRPDYQAVELNILPAIASNGNVAMVTWTKSFVQMGFSTRVAASVSADAVIGPAREIIGGLPGVLDAGAAGETAVFWMGAELRSQESPERCFAGPYFPFTATLVPFNAAAPSLPILLSDLAGARHVAFDGTAFQVFWINANANANHQVLHRTIFEDGTMGAVHVILEGGRGEICLDADSDGAGRTWLTITTVLGLATFDMSLAIDTATGMTRPIWQSSSTDRRVVSSVWAGSELHLVTSRTDGSTVVYSVNGTSDAIRTRDVEAELGKLAALHVVDASTLYGALEVPSRRTLVELNADFMILREASVPGLIDAPLLARNPTYVQAIEPTYGSIGVMQPGRLELVQLDRGLSELQRQVIVTDAEPEPHEFCPPLLGGCGAGSPGGAGIGTGIVVLSFAIRRRRRRAHD